MITIIPDDYSPIEYNKLARHPLQTYEWGEARKKTGVEVLRLSDGKNVFQLTLHAILHVSYYDLTILKIGYLPRSITPPKEVLDFLFEYGIKNKIIFFKIEPNVLKQKLPPTTYGLQPSPHPLFPSWTN